MGLKKLPLQKSLPAPRYTSRVLECKRFGLTYFSFEVRRGDEVIHTADRWSYEIAEVDGMALASKLERLSN